MKPQLALHLYKEEEKKNPKYRGKEYAIFEKYDGWYGYYENGQIYSRAGRVIPSLTQLSGYLRAKLPAMVGRLIFEIMLPDMPFSELNGILNRKREQAKGAYLMVHDFIEVEDYPFAKRYQQAEELVRGLNTNIIRLAPILCKSKDKMEWKRVANEVWAKGAEGVILKDTAAYYEFGKRNCGLMKIKEEVTLDLRVVGMEPGQGKYEGTLGTLVVKGMKGTPHHISGMTDAQRDEWWRDPSSIISQIVEVKAMKILKDGSLREPRFKAVRFDKNEVDDV